MRIRQSSRSQRLPTCCHVIMYITYNPPTITSLPPYKPPSLPPSIIQHRRPHSQRKSIRGFRIFPYHQRLPTTNAACARFRRSQKIVCRLGPATPIVLAARLTAFKDMLAAVKIVHSTQMATVHDRLHASIDRFDTVRPILVTNPSLFSSSSLYDSVFIPHSLAPDK